MFFLLVSLTHIYSSSFFLSKVLVGLVSPVDMFKCNNINFDHLGSITHQSSESSSRDAKLWVDKECPFTDLLLPCKINGWPASCYG